MDWFVRAFIKASVAWLAAGVTLGVGMAVHAPWVVYRPAHLHLNLLGFVAMMIFGVGYHVLPRFAGHPLHRRDLAAAHWWLSNVGLILMAAGFILRPNGAAGTAAGAILTGAALSAAGAYAFAWNIWRTLDEAARAQRAAAAREAAGRSRPLPMALH
ncbi:MAG TPA: cbb3-type cytochrome c oxidase subunit I [Gemmatimonadales bacterium]|nr:cbb3-type cytochrome c oxidase subunit I [Gemmatimonadales bacterium]